MRGKERVGRAQKTLTAIMAGLICGIVELLKDFGQWKRLISTSWLAGEDELIPAEGKWQAGPISALDKHC